MALPPPSGFLELRHASTDHAIFVVVPERRFLAIDGRGDPGAADFALATRALLNVLDVLRSRLRRDGIATSTRAAAIECAWWPPEPMTADELPEAFADRTRWYWHQLVELPDQATEARAQAAIDEARRGAGREEALVRQVSFAEGSAGQLLHIGPRSGEPATVRKLYADIAAAGLRPEGRLHTLMLADPEHVPGGLGRSIIRQPVA
jgi:hypothetical protein